MDLILLNQLINQVWFCFDVSENPCCSLRSSSTILKHATNAKVFSVFRDTDILLLAIVLQNPQLHNDKLDILCTRKPHHNAPVILIFTHFHSRANFKLVRIM